MPALRIRDDPCATVSGLLQDTRNLLDADSAAGRQMLRRCLPGPLKITPDGKGGWDYEGEGVFVEDDVRKTVEQYDVQSCPKVFR